jgi:hypothetical protein
MPLEKISRPKGQDKRYRFFRNPETGREWKVSLEIREAGGALVESDVPLAPSRFAVTLAASPVDDEGRALRDDEGRPIVTDSWTHTFYESETSADDFDPAQRVAEIAEQRVLAGEAKLAGERKLEALAKRW